MRERKLDLTPRSPTQLAHVVIFCHHFEKTREWYKTVLNATESYGNDGSSFLAYDDEHHRLALFLAPPLDNSVKRLNGVQHFAYTLPSVAALLGQYERLAKLDIKPIWTVHHGVTLSIYYEDPEGVQVEFQVDAFVNMTDAKDFMASEAFDRNPAGINFDPEIMKERFFAGESETQLLSQEALPQ